MEIGNGSVLDYKIHSDQETTIMYSSRLTEQSRSNAARTPGREVVLDRSDVADTSTFPPRWPRFPIPKKHNSNSYTEDGKDSTILSNSPTAPIQKT